MGLAKFLIRDHDRDDVVYPGHPLLPEVPRGTQDLDWMPIVAQMGWIALTRDRRIRSRPAELVVYREQGLCSVWIGGKHDHSLPTWPPCSDSMRLGYFDRRQSWAQVRGR